MPDEDIDWEAYVAPPRIDLVLPDMSMVALTPASLNNHAEHMSSYHYRPREEWTCEGCETAHDGGLDLFYVYSYTEYDEDLQPHTFCDSCHSDEYRCGSCGRGARYMEGELVTDENGDERFYCENCGVPESERIHYYSYKPPAIFHGTTSNVFFGIELETESSQYGDAARGTLAEKWFERSNGERDYYQKEDGSLCNGIEIVSHPRTLDSWREYCASEFAGILADMARAGAQAWKADSCGLHVHVSRDAFNDVGHLERFALLFNKNHREAIRFARRASDYAIFEYENHDEDEMERIIRSKACGDGRYYAEHFDAINLNGNDGNTVEVRIFRPSLAVARVLGSIEVVAAAVEFTRTIESIRDIWSGALKWEIFVQYMGEHDYTCASAIQRHESFNVARTLTESLNDATLRITESEEVLECV